MTRSTPTPSAIHIIVLVLLSIGLAEVSAQVGLANDPAEPSAKASLRITEPKSHDSADRADQGKKPDGSSALAVFGSLALVLGVFFALVWVLRRASPQGASLLPAEAFEVLGRAPLANRQQAHLLRCGNKLLLISAGTAGTEPLTEITDPAEVDRLTELCRQVRPNIATTALSRILGQKGKSNG
jgi:flagellar biogenesis protein FliO